MQSSSPLTVATGQDSAAGKKETNEDSMGIFVPTDLDILQSKGVCAVIADGVSAADAGREAAETCVKNFLSDYFSTPDTWTVQTSAQKVLTALNRWLYGQSARFTSAQKGYVCTLSILIVKSRTAYLFHVGDTRIHQRTSEGFKQLTRDHAIRISSSDSYLSRAMGLDSNIAVDFQTLPVEPGDVFLLTSDGIHDYVDRRTMAAICDATPNLGEACQELITAALNQGSHDNLTCQLLRVEQVPDATVDEYLRRLTELPFSPELSSGMVLDGYKIVREIHASRRSQLYLAERVETGEPVVMKTPSVNYEDDPAYIERFILEQWVGMRVKNPHLVRSLAPPEHRSCLYNLMEYVDGITVGQWIANHRRRHVKDPSEVVGLIAQVVRGLYALHRKEIIHQDLKPDNIVIGSDGVVKVIDYGSCYVAGVDEIASPIVRDKILGTVSYAAPEYSLDYGIGPRADMYSLGCIAYEMLTGHHPYGPESDEQARTPSYFATLSYTPAYVHNPHVPVWMDGALQKAVRIRPSDRYGELSEFIYDLENPNPDYLTPHAASTSRAEEDRNWKRLAFIMLACNVFLLVLLARAWTGR